MNDTVINKIQSVQRCIKRARDIYDRSCDAFLTDYDAQDAAVLNILRACELTIDIANFIIKQQKLGIPTSSSESFTLLSSSGVIDTGLAEKLKKMVGFRNVSVHDYQRINNEIVVSVINKGLDDLLAFTDKVCENLSKS
jgi:uncharacterized protein YutE (UPF0331/DUF86 family)